MKIIIVILIPAPLLALSQAMCLAPAICPLLWAGRVGRAGRESLRQRCNLKLLSIVKVIEGRSQTLSTPVVE